MYLCLDVYLCRLYWYVNFNINKELKFFLSNWFCVPLGVGAKLRTLRGTWHKPTKNTKHHTECIEFTANTYVSPPTLCNFPQNNAVIVVKGILLIKE